jgi:endonuclease/exonuclease/phosphatase family metal-dependent hydrolase
MTLRVATLNIWNRCGPWEQRLGAIRAGVAALSPDLLGLQEVVRLDPGDGDGLDQAEAIARGLGYAVAYGRAHDEPFYGNAALSRWPILRSQTFELPRCGTGEKRTLLFAEIDSPHGLVPFFVTHLNWKFDEGHVRAAQVRDIAKRIDSVLRPGTFPAVLVGDFNAEPDSDEIRFLRGLTSLGEERRVYYQDAFGVAGGQAEGHTFARRNAFAAPLCEPDRRIDYVFVKGCEEPGRGQPLEAAVCFDAEVAGAFPSDHFGVVATLRTG